MKRGGVLVAASNKETLRKVQAAWNENRLDDLDQYFATDFKANSNMRTAEPGLAGAKESHRINSRIFSDRKVEVLDVIEEDDKVVLRNRATGRHTGPEPWMSAPNDGTPYEIESWSIYRFRNGKIVEHWGLNDARGLITQIGGQLPQRAAPRSP